MLARLGSLVRKELIQLSRDRLLLAFVIVAPVMQMILIGNSIAESVSELPLAVYDQDRSDLSRAIITALDETDELELVYYPSSIEEVQDLVESGQATVAVVMPPGLSRDAASLTNVPELQVIIDGTNAIVGGTALGAIQSAIEAKGREFAPANVSLAGGINLDVRAEYNQTLDRRQHTITAQLAFISFQVTVIVAVMGLVREKETGTLDQLAITPLNRLELLLGKAIVPLMVGLFDYLLMFFVTIGIFSVPMRGSVLLLFGLSFFYLVAECGYALMLSTLSNTQQQAITLSFVWMMLAMTLSGYMVPVSRMPAALRVVSLAFPLRHYLTIIRGVMLKGAGMDSLWPSVVALLVLSVVVTWATVRLLGRVNE